MMASTRLNLTAPYFLFRLPNGTSHIEGSWIYAVCAEQVEDYLMKDDGQVVVGSPWAERSLAGSLVRAKTARMIVIKIQLSIESLVNKLEGIVTELQS